MFTVDELLHIMLVMSAADAAYTLANAYGPGLPAFIAKMNAEAAQARTDPHALHLARRPPVPNGDLHLLNPGGARAAGRGRDGLSGVPLDRAASPLQPAEGRRPQRRLRHLRQRCCSPHYQGAVGIKTGFTNAAGHTLLFEAVRGGRTLIGDVLGSPLSGFASGAQDAAKVLNWGFSLKQSG